MRHLRLLIVMFIVMLLLSSSTRSDDHCRPPLTSFDTHRLELEDGWLHTTGGVATETRVVEVDYIDNRRIATTHFESQGSVTLSSMTSRRIIRYRHEVTLPHGDYHVSIQSPTPHYEVCAQDGEVVLFLEQVISSDNPQTFDWHYTVTIELLGDLNNDGVIGGYDMGLLFAAWGTPDADLNNDGITDSIDLGILLENWQ